MPKRTYYIPLKDDSFFNFQRILVDTVSANKVAWGIPDSAVDALTARRAEYEPRYHKSQNENTRTRTDVLSHRQMRKTYEKELRIFVKGYLMFNPAVSSANKTGMGLTVHDTEPSPRPAISDIPVPFLAPLGGGTIKVTCRRATDQTRPSIHPDADGIECRYIFVPKGEMPPKSWEDCSKTQTFKKARFIISCGVENSGHSFYGFFRWVNISNPANSGPWSYARSVVIA